MQQQHLVDVPKELFRIFSEKYRVGESEEKIIDDTPYLIQPLNIKTNAKFQLPLLGDKSVVTIGLCQSGVEGSKGEVTRFFVWNHVPEVCGVQSLCIWAGIHGLGYSNRERIIIHLGNTSDAFDPIVPEAVFIAEVIKTIYEIGKDIKPRTYSWVKDRYVSGLNVGIG